jgi:hypothetical protein
MVWLGWPSRFPGFFPAQAHVFFGLWAAYLLLYLSTMLIEWRYSREARAGLYVANVIYQAVLLDSLINSVWVG